MICEPPKVASKALPRQRAHRMTTSRVCRTTHEEVALREPSGKKTSVSETYTNCIDLLIDVIIAAERACDESKTVESTLGEEEPQSHSSFPYSVADVDNLNGSECGKRHTRTFTQKGRLLDRIESRGCGTGFEFMCVKAMDLDQSGCDPSRPMLIWSSHDEALWWDDCSFWSFQLARLATNCLL